MSVGVVYRLSSNDESATAVYIGSTTNLYLRLNVHRCDARKKKSKIYDYINEHGGFSNWKCDILEEVEFTDKQSLLKRERYWYDKHNNLLNTNKPGRSMKEWEIDNADRIKEYQRQYYLMKKEKLLNKQIEVAH